MYIQIVDIQIVDIQIVRVCTEDIEHFLLDCEALTPTRQYVTGLQRPYKENRETHIAEFLLFNNKINQNIIIRNRDDLQKLWQHRNSIMLQKC